MAVVTAIIMMSATAWYCYQLMNGRVRTVLSGWIILSTTMVLGFTSYWFSPVHTWTGNIGNLVGVASTLSVFVTVLMTNPEWKFNSFQKMLLKLAGSIMIVWVILRILWSGDVAAIVVNVLTQVLMTIGYVAFFEKLLGQIRREERHTESLVLWGGVFASTLTAIPPAVMNVDWLGMLYLLRAVITSGLTFSMIVWLEWRSFQKSAVS